MCQLLPNHTAEREGDGRKINRLSAVMVFVTVFAIALSLAVPASGAFLQDGTGLVSMEAEHYGANVPQGGHSWDPVASVGYSGSGVLQALPSDGLPQVLAGAGPRMDYQVEFTRTGTHYVWIRGLGFSGSSDSLYVGLDGGTKFGSLPVHLMGFTPLLEKWI